MEEGLFGDPSWVKGELNFTGRRGRRHRTERPRDHVHDDIGYGDDVEISGFRNDLGRDDVTHEEVIVTEV